MCGCSICSATRLRQYLYSCTSSSVSTCTNNLGPAAASVFTGQPAARRQRTRAYGSIRQHTSVFTGQPAARRQRCQRTRGYGSIRQHTSAYGSIRQHSSAYLQRDVSVASGRAHGERVRNKRHVEKLLLAGLQQRLLRQYLYFCTSKASKLSSTCAFCRTEGERLMHYRFST